MPCQVKTEPLNYFEMTAVKKVFQAHDMLYDMGYRGTLRTDGASASIDMHQADLVSVQAGVGTVLVYRPGTPMTVIECVTAEEFTAKYNVT